MVTRNALQRQSAGEYQPPRNREERRQTRIEQERQFKKRAKAIEKRIKRKKQIKEAAVTIAFGLFFGGFLAYLLFLAPDPGAEYMNQKAIEWRRAQEDLIPAINSTYLIPAEDYLDRYPFELSGGQLQRISILRSMLLNPEFLVADEPVSMLDVSVRADIINMLTKLVRQHGSSMVFISHDIATTRYISDRTIVMYLGRIVEIGNSDDILHLSLIHI